MKVYFNGERMKLKKKKLSKEEREFADQYWGKIEGCYINGVVKSEVKK